MRKLIILFALICMPLLANATYNQKNYSKYSHSQKHKNGAYGNPLVGTKMPKGCKWVWVNGKKQTRCGHNKHKIKLAKFCKKHPNHHKCNKAKKFCDKYPNHHKCKDKPTTGVSEPTPLALLLLSLFAAYFARRK